MMNLQETYFSIYTEENEERRSALAKADKNYRSPWERGNRVRDKVDKLINSDNPEDVKRGEKIHAANAQGSKKSITKSARNIQRGPGPRMAKVDAERDMRSSGFKEEVDVYDLVLEYLMEEGFVDNVDAAINIMSVMGEEWIDYILEGFVPLSDKKKERVTGELNKSVSDTAKDKARMGKLSSRLKPIPQPFRRAVPGYSELKGLVHKYKNPKGINKPQLRQNALDSLMHTQIDKEAKNISRRNEIKRKLRELEN